MSMTTPCCEKHEWPGGMDRPCPDCDELAKMTAQRDAALLQNDEWKRISQDQARVIESQAIVIAAHEELLRQADDLYTGYGLICGPIKDAGYPEYEGNVDPGEWIGKVRAIVRRTETR